MDEDLSIMIPTSARSRSAPDHAQKSVRKNWNASSINIQTARGEKMHLQAPGEWLQRLGFFPICNFLIDSPYYQTKHGIDGLGRTMVMKGHNIKLLYNWFSWVCKIGHGLFLHGKGGVKKLK